MKQVKTYFLICSVCHHKNKGVYLYYYFYFLWITVNIT